MLVPQVLAACLLLAGCRCAEHATTSTTPSSEDSEERVIGDIAKQWSAMVDEYQRKERAQHHDGLLMFPADLMMVMKKHSEDDVLNEVNRDDHRAENPAPEEKHPDGKTVLVFLEKELELMDPDGSHARAKPEGVILVESGPQDPAPTCPAPEAERATTENELGAFLDDLNKFMAKVPRPLPPPPPPPPRNPQPSGNDIVAFLEGLVMMQAAEDAKKEGKTVEGPPEAWLRLLGPQVRRRRDAEQTKIPAIEQLHPFRDDDGEVPLAAPADVLNGDVNLSGLKDIDASDVIDSISRGELQAAMPEDAVVDTTSTSTTTTTTSESPGWVIHNLEHQPVPVVKMVPIQTVKPNVDVVQMIPVRHPAENKVDNSLDTSKDAAAGHNHVAKKELHDQPEDIRMVESNNGPVPIEPSPQQEELKAVEEDPLSFEFPGSVGDMDAVKDILGINLQFEDNSTNTESATENSPAPDLDDNAEGGDLATNQLEEAPTDKSAPTEAEAQAAPSPRSDVLLETGKHPMPSEDDQQEQLDRTSFVRSAHGQQQAAAAPCAEAPTEAPTEAPSHQDGPHHVQPSLTTDATKSETFDLAAGGEHLVIQEPCTSDTTPQPPAKKKKKRKKGFKMPFMVPTTTKAPWPRSLASLAGFVPFPDITRTENTQARPPTHRRTAARRFKAFPRPAPHAPWQHNDNTVVEVVTLPPLLPALHPLHYHGHHQHHHHAQEAVQHAAAYEQPEYQYAVYQNGYQLQQQPEQQQYQEQYQAQQEYPATVHQPEHQQAMYQPLPQYQPQAEYQVVEQEQNNQVPAYQPQPEYQVSQPKSGGQAQAEYQPQTEYQQTGYHTVQESQVPAYQQLPEYQPQNDYQQVIYQPEYQPATFDQSQNEYQQPQYQQPAYQQPEYQQPEYQHAQYQQPEYQQSAYQPQQQTEYQQAQYQQPEYQQPEYQQPEYQQPEYQQPEYQQPEYQQAQYQQPEYKQAQYQQPEYQQAQYQQVQYQLPEYQQAAYQQQTEYQPSVYSDYQQQYQVGGYQPEYAVPVADSTLQQAYQTLGNWGATRRRRSASAAGPIVAIEQEGADQGLEQPAKAIIKVPSTEAPNSEAPSTEAPNTEAPSTEAPSTEVPSTEAPSTEAPTTEASTTEASTTAASTTEDPTTEASTEVDPELSTEPIPQDIPETVPAVAAETVALDDSAILAADDMPPLPPMPVLRQPLRLSPLHNVLAADTPLLARRARQQDGGQHQQVANAVANVVAADDAGAYNALFAAGYPHHHRPPPPMPPALEDLLPKTGETEEEKAEREQKAVQRMIQVVNVLGSLQSFLSDRARTVVRRLSKIVEDEEEQKLT